jgi:hypothetical protein
VKRLTEEVEALREIVQDGEGVSNILEKAGKQKLKASEEVQKVIKTLESQTNYGKFKKSTKPNVEAAKSTNTKGTLHYNNTKMLY